MKLKHEDVMFKKIFHNQDGVSRNYFDEIRKKKNYVQSNRKHIESKSIFLQPIYQKKLDQIKDKRFSITQNISPNNFQKKQNNILSKYSRKSFTQKNRLPLKNRYDSNSPVFTHENNYEKEFQKQKSNGKKEKYNRKEVNYSPNHNIINDRNESLNANNFSSINDSPSLTEHTDIKKYIDHKFKKEIKKLKYKEEEDINLVKEEYNKIKKEYDQLMQIHLKLKEEYNKLKNQNRKLNYERFEINRNLNEMYNSQIQNDICNTDILFQQISNLEEENKELKNQLKSKSSFLQNEKIIHFQLCFISEVTKKGDDNIKIKRYHTPDKINKNENNYNRLIEINNNENIKKLKDNYNDLQEKYSYLKNEFKKIINEFNIIKKQESNSNLNIDNSFCIINQASENIADVCNFAFQDINQNEEPKNLLEKNIINSACPNFNVNSIIQCLVNVNKLFEYFLNDFPKNSLEIKKKNNKNIKVLPAFHTLVEDIFQNKDKFSYNNSASLNKFKEVISIYYSKIFSLNCEDFLLNFLKILHEEFNYLDNKIFFKSIIYNTFNDFNKGYNINNSSIISDLFFGTYEYKQQCKLCKNITYNFKKFEFLSFGITKQYKKKFSIYDGFENNEKAKSLSYQCNNCRRFGEFECSHKIIEPPKELLININYSKTKPSKIEFDKRINISKFVNPDFAESSEYRISCICSKTESNYFTFCWNKDNEKWYILDNSSFKECDEKDIYLGYPYLLLYERL